jgi:Zn-dependent M28 family amino/carboxypeptidase
MPPCRRAAPWLLSLALAASAPAAALAQGNRPAQRARPAPSTVPAITARDLETRLFIFAADSMEGREAGTPGNVRATDYIARELARLGLVPGGDAGGYFQTIPLKIRTWDTTSTFAVGGVQLAPVRDYVPVVREAIAAAALPIVHGGALDDPVQRLAPEQAAGRLVVLTVRPGASPFRLLRAAAPPPGAAALAVVALDSLPARFRAFLTRPQAFLDDTAARRSRTPVFLVSAAAAAKMFPAPLDRLAVGAPGDTAALAIRYQVAPTPYPARNVIGILPGSDPKLRGEYVAIGAHNDHIGVLRPPVDHDSIRIWNLVVRPEGADDAGKEATPAQQARVDSLLAAFRARHPGADRPDSIANGADDDGSGSVAALEIAERFATLPRKPRRSILFVWHTAEEKGLLGSRYFTDHPTVPRDSIVAQLNMDMVGRGGADDETGRTKDGAPLHGGPRYLQLVGSRRLSTELGDLIERVNTADRHDLVLDYSIDADGHPANIYCRSDHYEYARYGIPITFFTTGLHADYHQVTDEPEYIDYAHMARVARFVADVALHVANLDHRLAVDRPKPDPDAPCRQ